MQLKPGDRLGSYEILGSLGVGGMGEVYRARDAKLGRDIAVKILPPDLASSAEALRRFEQEARAASALNHPSIVTIYDIEQTDSVTYIAMELVDGTDLRALANREPLSIKDAFRIAVKIADGLAAAHERGIVHRDLKPDNIMVTPEGFVKILDFGLAKQIRALSSNETTVPHTSPGAVFGTVGYMSPEQATGREMDARSDQFSFGVMLYEMFTRVRPFERESKAETMAAIIRDEPPPPSTINEALDHDVDRIVGRCLAKNPRERYASTRDLAHDLRELRDGLTHSSRRVYTRPPAAFGARKLRASSVVAAVILLALAGGATWMFRNRPLRNVTSIAVLPFEDRSATPEGRILADGLSDRVASRLGEIRELRIAAPFDRPRVEGSVEDYRAVAQRTGAQVLLRASVQRTPKEVSVDYALIDGRNGKTVLSRTTSRPSTELFALEDALAEELLGALGRPLPVRAQNAAAALGPADQQRFIEAVGLLQGVRSEQSVDRAIANLNALLRNARESGPVNALLARALLFKSSLARKPALVEQAMVYAARGVALSPNDEESYVTLGQVHNASGRPADAVKALQRALTIRPDMHSAIVALAGAYQQIGRDEDAEAMYRKAIALRPDLFGAMMNYGEFCYMRGRYQEAAANFRKATELVPDFSHAHANLGAALQAQGKNDEALAAYRRSLEIRPTAAGWSNLGTLQFYLGRYDEARKSYEQATTLAPSDSVTWANLGDACRVAGANDAARDAYARAIITARDALAAKPNDAYLRSLIALSLARNGSGDAQQEIRRALEADPTNPSVLYKAAVISALRGNEESAISWLERAVAEGYPAADAERDPDFAAMRGRPAFRNAVKSKS